MERIATIKKTKAICETYQLYTKKKFGQNFIIEPKVVEKIAQAAVLDKQFSVIEIGPGIGALTQCLAECAKQVYSFEIDLSLKQYWENEKMLNVEIIFEDFLKLDLAQFLQSKNEKFVVAANLPYYITTPILFKLFEYHFEKITVMMQKEVAERFNAKINTKHYNALSVIAQYKYHTKIEMDVSRTVFIPTPNVDSSVISFVEKIDREKLDEQQFYAFVHECFKQRRKTIYNNLRHYENITTFLQQCGIKENQRAQELEIHQFITLFKCINQR